MNEVAAALATVVAGAVLLLSGCHDGVGGRQGGEADAAGALPSATIPDTRESLGLTPEARAEQRAVMRQHLESVQQIVAALAREDYEGAQHLTETHLGFFMHRQAMLRQRPEDFPPAYHDLAMAHHQAADELAELMPTRDLKQILPALDRVLQACVACHNTYRP